MQFYDYQKCVTDDVENYLIDRDIDLEHSNIVDLTDKLCDADDITGAGSGSYTMSKIVAERNLVGNFDLLRDAVSEIWPDFNLLVAGAEAADVLIRQYLVPGIICDLALIK